MSGTDLCIIYNPKAGRGRATAAIPSLRRALGGTAEFLPTRGPGDAESLAFERARAGCPTVGAAGGDGTVHEVANGLLRAGAGTTLAVFPVGSADDYAYSLGLGAEWWRRRDRAVEVRRVDVGRVRSEGRPERYFVNGLGLGFNGYVTLESRRIRGLRGPMLYTLALLRALQRHFRCPPMRVRLDGKDWNGPTLALSLALGRREGNFLLAPRAEIDDGKFDYLHAGAVTPWKLCRHVPGMLSGTLPDDDPDVHMGLCSAASVEADEALVVHLDGEFYCRPEDGVRGVGIELLPAHLPVWARKRT